MRKALMIVACVIVAFTVVEWTVEYVWPVFDKTGSITSGTYRGISIGDSKEDVIDIVNGAPLNKLKITSFIGVDNTLILVFSSLRRDELRDSNRWGLRYPSIHRETIGLNFDEDRVVKITYHRDIMPAF